MTNKKFAYDQFSYSNDIFIQTHPDNLASIARLYGVNAPDVEKSRVLELGCGNGMNLISQAYGLPNSKLIGIDLAQNHIDQASDSVKELALENIEFKQIDILDMSTDEFGKFDYIIGHGLYSWIPDVVREKVINICNEMLTENGIGYLSYNVYPGWHYKKIASEIGRFHTRDIVSPEEKVEGALKFLNFVNENTDKDEIYGNCI